MKFIIVPVIVLSLFSCCMSGSKTSVDKSYADSLIRNYPSSEAVKITNSEILFWKNRINPEDPALSNELKYVSALVRRFRQLGDINDLSQAENVLTTSNAAFNSKEARIYLALSEIAMLRHKFKPAEDLLNKAKRLGIQSYVFNSASYDVEYELGHYNLASFYLTKIKSPTDYGYYFRQAKLSHLDGQADSALHHMLRAAELAPEGSHLQGVALANAADFYIHTGEFEKAAHLYKRCIAIDNSDFHSISGLGTIAMKYDHNYPVAGSLFNLVKSQYKLPDGFFKLYQLAQSKNDVKEQRSNAQQFVALAAQPKYGKMYSKYLIEIYTGILNKPLLAENIAREELKNRLTPQTAAWYAWTLYNNKKSQQAEIVYKKYVSGKPLEGFELFYMGKLMEGLNKAYTSDQFYKAASQNKFDLSPAMIEHLESR
jgi:hypothetical protein